MTEQKLVFGDQRSIAERDRAARAKISGYWRGRARPLIAAAIAGSRGKPMEEVRRAVSNAYPFGERKNHPYAMWLKEANEQLGKYAREQLSARNPA